MRPTPRSTSYARSTDRCACLTARPDRGLRVSRVARCYFRGVRYLVLGALVACGSEPPRVASVQSFEVADVAAKLAVATQKHDATYVRSLLHERVHNGGAMFVDADCKAKFAKPGTVAA